MVMYKLALIYFCLFGLYANGQNCVSELESTTYCDTTTNVLKTMGLVQHGTNHCETYILRLVNKDKAAITMSFQEVYAMQFYYKSDNQILVEIAFSANGHWSKSVPIKLDASEGRYFSVPVSLYSNFDFKISAIESIRLKLSDATEVLIDEIEYLQFEHDLMASYNDELRNQLIHVEKKYKEKKDEEHKKRWFRDRGNIRD